MGAQPTTPAGRVRESLVITATFGPLAVFHLLSQTDVQVKSSFFYFKRVREIFFLKSGKNKYFFW